MTQTLGSDTEQPASAPAAPPFGERWRYELYGHRLPEQYRAWAERDIASRWWPWKQTAARVLWFCFAALIVGALTAFRIEFLAGPIAFVVLSVPITPLVADRWRIYARRTQGIEGPPPWWVLSGAQAWIAGGMCLVAAVAIALVFVFRDPLSDRLHPDRCTAVPAATRAAITAAGDPGSSFSGFQQRRHGRWTGIAAIVTLGSNRGLGMWAEDRSVTPHRISAVDTLSAARTPSLPLLDRDLFLGDAGNAARSAVTCLILTP